MPHLMVNLEDARDCKQAMGILRERLGRGGCGGGRRGRRAEHSAEEPDGNTDSAKVADLPLPQKLKRIQSRAMWTHLVRIAESTTEPMSLPELDALLDFPKNKMRSLKAIMAKLENRFGIQFLKVDLDAGVDASGNPRYTMVPKVRKQILRLAAAS